MANTKPSNQTDLSDPTARDHLFKSLYNDGQPDATLFKSFDFSNVALYGDSADSNFRRFHQMTLYIQVPSVYNHANQNIRKGQTIILSSNLPQSISYKVGSKWEQPLNFQNATLNLLMQMAGSAISKNLASGVARASTMKVWNGSDNLSLSLKIPVLDDSTSSSGTNLVEALEILGSLSLPSLGGYGFYIPPPSPLRASIIYSNKNMERKTFTMASGGAARIMLQLGGILLVDRCIIEGFTVKYPNTKTMIKHDYVQENFGVTGNEYLHPLLAEVTLNITTVEAMTANTYSRMLWARDQNNQGAGSLDTTPVTDWIHKNTGGVI